MNYTALRSHRIVQEFHPLSQTHLLYRRSWGLPMLLLNSLIKVFVGMTLKKAKPLQYFLSSLLNTIALNTKPIAMLTICCSGCPCSFIEDSSTLQRQVFWCLSCSVNVAHVVVLMRQRKQNDKPKPFVLCVWRGVEDSLILIRCYVEWEPALEKTVFTDWGGGSILL